MARVLCIGDAQQIVGPEPREATFASSVIRLSCSVAPWPGQLKRCAATLAMRDCLIPGLGFLVIGIVVLLSSVTKTGRNLDRAYLKSLPRWLRLKTLE